MSKSKSDQPHSLKPHRFSVHVDRDKVVDFVKSVTRQDNIPSGIELEVPVTFVASWFGLPEVDAFVLNAIGSFFDDEQHITLHAEQSIKTIVKLKIEKNYFLDVESSASIGDGKFEVLSKVRDLDDKVQLELRSIFLIIETDQAAS